LAIAVTALVEIARVLGVNRVGSVLNRHELVVRHVSLHHLVVLIEDEGGGSLHTGSLTEFLVKGGDHDSLIDLKRLKLIPFGRPSGTRIRDGLEVRAVLLAIDPEGVERRRGFVLVVDGEGGVDVGLKVPFHERYEDD
jgi:hypothetical protein